MHAELLRQALRFYGVDATATHLIDMDAARAQALEFVPKRPCSLPAGRPTRESYFARFKSIAEEVGSARLWWTAHFAGLVAAGLHPSPVPHG